MFSACKVYSKKFWAQFHGLCPKRSGLLLSSDAFFRFLRPKTKLFAVKVRRILEVLCLQGLQKKIPGAMSRNMCPKTKVFPVKFRRILEVFALQGLHK